MKDIKCPVCNRNAKLKECVSRERGRKRIMLEFPCYHFVGIVYNVPVSMDNNTIVKDFNSISKEYFDIPYLSSYHRDRYLD